MTPQEWIIEAFVFAFGCCIGSFLNVVIYRLPRGKSLVSPGSACPKCGKFIRWYDNIPLLSWLELRAKCRYCKSPISARYFVVELLTGCVFLGLYWVYFHASFHPSTTVTGGWLVYVLHVILIAAFIAGSGIDLELWIIPLSICWLVTAVGLIGSTVAGYVIDPKDIKDFMLLPTATPATGSLALGAALGLAISLILLKTGVLKRSYEQVETGAHEEQGGKPDAGDPHFNHRLESLREIVFLAPIIILAIIAYYAIGRSGGTSWWKSLLQVPAAGGFFGSMFGYFVGCATIWVIRILGTLGFGKEAMGLGDVHLLGAAGAVIGPWMAIVVAVFVAPFSGLGWAVVQMFSKKTHEIPYGPHLSVGVLCVMIGHDWILTRIAYLLP